ncbi:hypothetical protein T12_2655 [Trichinella patagoniensis]|uniref:Uncharacterized protein n=1 Tax=Trichinella patagoniensis TaxID=990121 RepID=A0A0V0YRL6_9BILA|nr:hypothetical protein T12_2655 [Trichinella patagoniensis]
MYRLAEVEVAALYPRIREVTPNCRPSVHPPGSFRCDHSA